MIDEYVKKWLIKAKGDLKVAENEMKLPPESMVTEAICFHCQQRVEKFIKAFLITKKKEFGKTHNLEFLLELCGKEDEDFKDLDVGNDQEIGNLSFYALR